MPSEEQQPLIRGLRVDPKTGRYRVDISIAGHRVQIATRTSDREEAEAMVEKIRQRLWGRAVLGEEPAITWAELEPEYLRKLETKGNRTVDNTRIKLDWLRPHLGHLALPEITSTIIARVLEQRRQEGKALKLRKGEHVPRVVPLQPTTLNRYWAVISGMLHLAQRTSRISAVPMWDGKVPEARGRAKVIRWLTHEQAERLHNELPEHIRPMYRFALATGLRKDNVCSLEWGQVDLARRLVHVSADDAKGKRNLGIPLSDEAARVLRSVHGQHDAYVFTYQSTGSDARRRIYEPAGRAWKLAKARAGIDKAFRWHDLRHTWATWHVQNGTPLEVLKELGGWASLEMVMVYAHLSTSHLAQFADNSR